MAPNVGEEIYGSAVRQVMHHVTYYATGSTRRGAEIIETVTQRSCILQIKNRGNPVEIVCVSSSRLCHWGTTRVSMWSLAAPISPIIQAAITRVLANIDYFKAQYACEWLPTSRKSLLIRGPPGYASRDVLRNGKHTTRSRNHRNLHAKIIYSSN